MHQKPSDLLARLNTLNAPELRRLLVERLIQQKLGLYWESDALERDRALNAKQATHRGKIRVIYIDPPYNAGNKDWVYNDHYVGANDRWRHSQWLEFLFRRLTLARDLLTADGVILVSINDENRSRLELLMDEVFSGRRLRTMTWRTRQGSNADQQCFLSVDHEHVLVYGNPGFSFNGFTKSYEMCGNPDQDPRGDWRIGDITFGFSHKERPNLYYPLLDPKTGIFYPCSPESVWRYATEAIVKEGQRLQAKTMEEFAGLGQIVFPSNPRVETWPTMDALVVAIDNGDVPKGGKSLLLRRDLPNLNSNQEGARVVTEIFGDCAFNYAKPLSLIKNLLQQATRPGDIGLDFFAGSDTDHAVLELNAEDNGQRRFILCSSTEATRKEPDKNLCRDVCAERLRRVMRGYGSAAQAGEVAPGVRRISQSGDCAHLMLPEVNSAVLAALESWLPTSGAARLAIWHPPSLHAVSKPTATACSTSCCTARAAGSGFEAHWVCKVSRLSHSRTIAERRNKAANADAR